MDSMLSSLYDILNSAKDPSQITLHTDLPNLVINQKIVFSPSIVHQSVTCHDDCTHMITQQVTPVRSQSQLSRVVVRSTPRLAISNMQAEISKKPVNG